MCCFQRRFCLVLAFYFQYISLSIKLFYENLYLCCIIVVKLLFFLYYWMWCLYILAYFPDASSTPKSCLKKETDWYYIYVTQISWSVYLISYSKQELSWTHVVLYSCLLLSNLVSNIDVLSWCHLCFHTIQNVIYFIFILNIMSSLIYNHVLLFIHHTLMESLFIGFNKVMIWLPFTLILQL